MCDDQLDPEDRHNSERLAYTLTRAAKLLDLSYSSLYRLIKSNRIKTISVFRKRLVPRAELERFLAEHTSAYSPRTPKVIGRQRKAS